MEKLVAAFIIVRLLRFVIGAVVVCGGVLLYNHVTRVDTVMGSPKGIFYVNRDAVSTEIVNNVSSMVCPSWVNIDDIVNVAQGNRGLIVSYNPPRSGLRGFRLVVYNKDGTTERFDVPKACTVRDIWEN